MPTRKLCLLCMPLKHGQKQAGYAITSISSHGIPFIVQRGWLD